MNKNKVNLLFSSGLAILLTNLIGVPALAQEQSNKTKDVQIDEVLVESSKEQSVEQQEVYSAPQSTVVITAEKIDRFRGTSPGDIFKGEAGIQVGDIRNSGAIELNIRGMQSQGRVPVAIDGSQQQITVYRGYSGVSDRSYIDPDLISSVQIIKGPSLNADASSALGGMVYLNTLEAADILLPNKKIGVRLRAGSSSNAVNPLFQNGNDGVYVTPPRISGGNKLAFDSASIAVAYKNKLADLVFAHSYRKLGNYFSGTKGYDQYYDPWTDPTHSVYSIYKAGNEITNTSNTTKSWLLKGKFNLTDDKKLELGYRRLDSEFGEIMGSQIIRNDDGFVHQWALGDIHTDAYTAKFKWIPENNNWINFKSGLWYTHLRSNTSNTNPFTSPLFDMGHTNEYESERTRVSHIKSDKWGIDATNISTFDNKYGIWSLTVGGAYNAEKLRPQKGYEGTASDKKQGRAFRNGDRYEYSLLSKLDWSPNDKFDFSIGTRFIGFYSQDNNELVYRRSKRPVRNAKLEILAPGAPWATYVDWPEREGGFYDRADVMDKIPQGAVITGGSIQAKRLEYNNYNAKPRIAGYRFRNTDIASIMSASWHITDNVQGYLRYAESVRMPSLFETTHAWSADPVPWLKPEKAHNVELGVSAMLNSVFKNDDGLNAKAAYFNNNTTDYISRRQDNSAKSYLSFYNMDSAKFSGIELQASYDMNQFFIDANYTYHLKAEICSHIEAEHWRSIGLIVNNEHFKNIGDCTDRGFPGGFIGTHIPPKNSVGVTTGVRLLNKKLTLGLRAVYNGEPGSKPTADDWAYMETSFFHEWKPQLTIDLFATYKYNQNLVLDAGVENITDEYYMDPLTKSLTPAPGRKYKIMLTGKF